MNNFVVLFLISASFSSICYAGTEAETLYKANCLACHGESGRGDGPAAKAMNTIKPRNFVKDKFKNGDSEAEIANTISQGIPPLMPSWKSQLSEQEIRLLAQYIKKIKRSSP